MSKAWKKFNYFMDVYPFTSNLVIAGFLYGTGDLVCQGIELYKYGFVVTKSIKGLKITNNNFEKNTNINENNIYEKFLEKIELFDYARILRMTIHGTFIFGISSFYFYSALEKHLEHFSKNLQVFLKVSIDELIYSPLSISALFASLSIMEGKNKQQIINKIKKDFLPTFIVDLIVWPILQTINFYFLPLKYRVLYISFCSLFWNVFLSSMHNSVTQIEEITIQNSQI